MVQAIYAFNITFTRADEGHKTVHEVGYSANGRTRFEAVTRIHEAFSHVKVLSVTLFSVMDSEGTIISELAAMDPIVTDPENPSHCFFCDNERSFYKPLVHEPDCLWLRAQPKEGL